MTSNIFHLGIDLGSISLKVALLNEQLEIVFARWVRVAGQPLLALSLLLDELNSIYSNATIMSVGITGSGRSLIENKIPSKSVNEISAQAEAVATLYPHIRTVIEIGGQDSKLIILDEDKTSELLSVRDFRMNELCAAGTGAFLDQQAARLGLTIDDFAKLALDAKNPAPIAGRCAVFAKTDMTHHQQEGKALADIVAGLGEALARSYLANLVRGKDLPRPISFQGGVASNASLVATFRRLLNVTADDEFIVPKHHKVMGAIGACLKGAKEWNAQGSVNLSLLISLLSAKKDTADHAYKFASALGEPLSEPALKPIEPDLTRLELKEKYLGIDVGSVSVKFVVLGPQGIVLSDYRFSDGKPLEALRTMLANMCDRLNPSEVAGVGVTGSGRHFVGKLIGADAIRNEITAQALAANLICPDVDTVMEIGGQDAKFMRLDKDRPSHFAMNRVCAAGTGAFLQEQSKRLEVDLNAEFANMAFESKRPALLGARCTVFMESDLVSHQQMGFEKIDLVAGLANSVVANYMEKVVAGFSLGKRILFLGGVAENKAVTAALEASTGKSVMTSTVGKLSGAIGAALAGVQAVKDRGKRTKSFSLQDTKLKFERKMCEDCANHCQIVVTEGDVQRFFGGRCGKWDSNTSRPLKVKDSLLKQRQELIFNTNKVVSSLIPYPSSLVPAFRIGIPRALFAFDMLPAWKTFFEHLGCEVVLSPETDDKILSEGIKRLVVETCLPVKAFCSHIHWLDKRGVDFIFVPSLVITGCDAHGKETAHCPYIQSLVQFAKPVAKTPLLNPVINWKLDPNSECVAMAGLAPLLGKSHKQANLAWRAAAKAQQEFRIQLRNIGMEALKNLASGKISRAFVLLGKDYNVLDERLSSRIASILEAQGETVLTQDMLAADDGNYSAAYRTMYWSHGKEILSAAQIAAKTDQLYPILITSFGCGPDSFTIKFTRDIMGKKPMLVLEVDEHSSSIGMETRIEAFIDSLPSKTQLSSPDFRKAFVPQDKIKRVFLPNFSDHGYAFAAALRTLGFTPVLTPLPDDESAKLGAKYASSGECHPYVLMLGDFLKVASKDEDLSDACYFMPESGACRVGQFGAQMRLAAEDMGVSLPVFTRIEDLASSLGTHPRLGYVRSLFTYWEMMRGMDFLSQKHLETRAYETVPGAADNVREKAREILMECIFDEKPLDGLKKASELLSAVPTDRSQQRVKIGITGDYFTRICDYANGEMFRDIERMGGVVMLPPSMSEFVKYNSYQKPAADFKHRNVADFLQSSVLRFVVESREKRVRKIAGSDLDYDIPLEYNRAKKLIEPYMDMKLPAGLTGSVAAILEQIAAGADGIVSAITFHCNYGLAIGSVLSLIDKDHPDIPKLTLIFEGLKPTHNRLRLEAFMERVHDAAKRRRMATRHSEPFDS
ncbi:MAG: acyl-CoA dehydratase activase [Pseudomonadota bacterium]